MSETDFTRDFKDFIEYFTGNNKGVWDRLGYIPLESCVTDEKHVNESACQFAMKDEIVFISNCMDLLRKQQPLESNCHAIVNTVCHSTSVSCDCDWKYIYSGILGIYEYIGCASAVRFYSTADTQLVWGIVSFVLYVFVIAYLSWGYFKSSHSLVEQDAEAQRKETSANNPASFAVGKGRRPKSRQPTKDPFAKRGKSPKRGRSPVRFTLGSF